MTQTWTWATVWGLTMEEGGRLGRGGKRRKNWDNLNSINNKIHLKKQKQKNKKMILKSGGDKEYLFYVYLFDTFTLSLTLFYNNKKHHL